MHWLVEAIVKSAVLIPLGFAMFRYINNIYIAPQLIILAFFATSGLATYTAKTPQRRATRILASTDSKLAPYTLIGALKYSEKRTRKLIENTVIRTK